MIALVFTVILLAILSYPFVESYIDKINDRSNFRGLNLNGDWYILKSRSKSFSCYPTMKIGDRIQEIGLKEPHKEGMTNLFATKQGFHLVCLYSDLKKSEQKRFNSFWEDLFRGLRK